jgi:hypothetical protein
MERAMLELCPDPMCDRYRIRADIRFIASKVMETGKVDGPAGAGLYFAGTTTPGRTGTTALALFEVHFNDYRTAPKVIKKGQSTGGPELRGFLYFQDPNPNGTPKIKNPTFAFHQSLPAGGPGPWRRIVIDVSPERVRVWWGEPSEENAPFAEMTGDVTRKRYLSLQTRLTADIGNHGVVLPEWSPRMAIGIWNERAAIDFKNVTITPNP